MRISKKEKAIAIARILEDLYPVVPVPLTHEDPYTLLVAVILSARCTDIKVNQVTPFLFAKAKTAKAMAKLDVDIIREIIKSCGLSPAKSKNIKQMSTMLADQYGGQVPQTFEELEALPGVGHKTASVVMAQAFGVPAFPVDTHIHRLAYRWGLSDGKNVEKTEADLKKLFPEDSWNKLHLQIIYFGRESVTNSQLLNSLNAGLTTDLSFRQFMDPLNIYHMIGHTKNHEKKAKIGGRLHSWLVEDASTRLSAGFNYVIISDLYDYYNINANMSYDIQPDPFRKLTITRIGFDLFVPNAYPEYQKILDSNKFLAESFGNQLYTGFLFRNYIYEVNSRIKSKAGHFRMLHSMELSGIEMYAINSVANLITGEFNEFVLNPNGSEDEIVEFSQFVKGEIDVRYFRNLTPTTELAIKLNTGVATPFGPYTKQVPYPKQFYVGGAQSNRAWQIRQLGPGGFEDKTVIPANVPFYQTGDFKIDFSAEIRFPLFWSFKGVLFMDAANVWITQFDASRPEADISKNFYKEFGIGYGYGIRLDLDFFIIRLDLGYKLHNPYPVIYDPEKPPSRWLVNELKKFPSGAEPQIAVGLPF